MAGTTLSLSKKEVDDVDDFLLGARWPMGNARSLSTGKCHHEKGVVYRAIIFLCASLMNNLVSSRNEFSSENGARELLMTTEYNKSLYIGRNFNQTELRKKKEGPKAIRRRGVVGGDDDNPPSSSSYRSVTSLDCVVGILCV